MIFLTVGSELPFDRLVQAVDAWSFLNPEVEIFGQIGDPGSSGYRPVNFPWQEFIPPVQYLERYDDANLIVGHAGMGSIINALVKAKPILIMPRLSRFRETRNDHQVGTSLRFASRKGILVAEDENKVGEKLNYWLRVQHEFVMQPAAAYAEERLLEAIRDVIFKREPRSM